MQNNNNNKKSRKSSRLILRDSFEEFSAPSNNRRASSSSFGILTRREEEQRTGVKRQFSVATASSSSGGGDRRRDDDDDFCWMEATAGSKAAVMGSGSGNVKRRWSLFNPPLPPPHPHSSSTMNLSLLKNNDQERTSSKNQFQFPELGCKPLSPPPLPARKSLQNFRSSSFLATATTTGTTGGNYAERKQAERRSSSRERKDRKQVLLFQEEENNKEFNFNVKSKKNKKYEEFLSKEERKRKLRYCKKKSENQNKIDFFGGLPDEMILRILKNLPQPSLGKVCQVSRRFSRLIRDEELWERVDCQSQTLHPQQLQILLERKPTILRLARATIETPQAVSTIQTKLTHLDLTMSLIPVEILSSFLSLCINVENLSLEHLNLSKACLTAMRNMNRIRVLNLTMCYFEGGVAEELVGVFQSGGCASGLTQLNLSCVKTDWTEDDLKMIINSLPASLEMLNLAGYRTLLKDSTASLIPSKTPNLIDLDLSDNQELTIKTVQEITKLKCLQHLSFSRCYSIEPFAYSLLTSLSNLRYLEIFSLFKESSLKNLAVCFGNKVEINQFPFSSIARPTVGRLRSSIWGKRVK